MDTTPLTRRPGSRWWEWAAYGFTFAFLFFCFQQRDLSYFGGSAFYLLNGHVQTFYDYADSNYLLPIHLLFAAWDLPLALSGLMTEHTMDAGGYVFWYKLLTTLFYVATAWILIRIGRRTGAGEASARLWALAWVTTPLAVYSQFIFGQTDIFTVFFLMLAVDFYLQRRLAVFSLLIGVACTFKYFPIFVFLPLLLLQEKRVFRVLGCVALAALPVLTAILPFAGSPGFQEWTLSNALVDKVFLASVSLDQRGTSVSIIFLLWFMLCGWAYFRNVADDREWHAWTFYLALASLAIPFSLIVWHPQWLIVLTPFMVITSLTSRHWKAWFLLDVVSVALLYILSVHHWDGNLDQTLWNLGVLGPWNPGLRDAPSALPMKALLPFPDTNLLWTALAAVLGLHVILKNPGREGAAGQPTPDPATCRPALAPRFCVGVFLFVIPAVVSYAGSYARFVRQNPPAKVQGIRQFDTGHYAAAVPALKAWAEEEPDGFLPHKLLGLALVKSGTDSTQAVSALQHTLARQDRQTDTDLEPAYAALALARARMGNTNEAFAALEQAELCRLRWWDPRDRFLMRELRPLRTAHEQGLTLAREQIAANPAARLTISADGLRPTVGQLDPQPACRLVTGPRPGTLAVWIEGLHQPTRLTWRPNVGALPEGSLAFWARLADPAKRYADLIVVYGEDSRAIYLYRESEGRFAGGFKGVALTPSPTPANVRDILWHHYVFTWAPGRQALYVDGREALLARTEDAAVQPTRIAVGWLGDGDQEQWHGAMTDVWLLSQALGQRQVLGLFQEYAGRPVRRPP